MNIFYCFKNGFGNQMDRLAYALKIKECTNGKLYIVSDINFLINNIPHTSILSKYLKIKDVNFINQSELSLDILQCFTFKKQPLDQQNIVTLYPELLYTDIRVNKYLYGFNNLKKVLLLSKYCDFKFDKKYNDFLIKYDECVCFHIRFFSGHQKFIKNKFDDQTKYTRLFYLFDLFQKLSNIRRKKLFVVCDNKKLFDIYSIQKLIHSSNIVDYDIYNNIFQNVDIFDSFDNISKFFNFQNESLILAKKMAACSSCVPTKFSSYSEILIPFLRTKLKNGKSYE